jgi:hypothetical protein
MSAPNAGDEVVSDDDALLAGVAARPTPVRRCCRDHPTGKLGGSASEACGAIYAALRQYVV